MTAVAARPAFLTEDPPWPSYSLPSSGHVAGRVYGRLPGPPRLAALSYVLARLASLTGVTTVRWFPTGQ